MEEIAVWPVLFPCTCTREKKVWSIGLEYSLWIQWNWSTYQCSSTTNVSQWIRGQYIAKYCSIAHYSEWKGNIVLYHHLYRRFHLMHYVTSLVNATMVDVWPMTGIVVHLFVSWISTTAQRSSLLHDTNSLAVVYTIHLMMVTWVAIFNMSKVIIGVVFYSMSTIWNTWGPYPSYLILKCLGCMLMQTSPRTNRRPISYLTASS